MTWVVNDFDRAVEVLNKMSSFLAFEFLEQSDTHLSRICSAIYTNSAFGLISVWNPELSIETNMEKTVSLLQDIRRVRGTPIQLLGHLDQYETADADYQQPERAFFIMGGSDGWLLALCRKYHQARVAATVDGQVKVLDSTGTVVKTFNRDLIEPHHVKRIWSSVSNRNYAWLESGFMDANPFYLCGPVWDSTGLRSDMPAHLCRRGQNVHHLIREKPFRSKEEIAQARFYEIQLRSSILAIQIVKALDSGKTVKAEEFREQLDEYCAKHNLNAEQVINAQLVQSAEILAFSLSRAQERGSEARVERCRTKLIDFCQRHNVAAEQAISNVEKRFRSLEQ